jgi:hypothetical protein
MTDIIVRVDNPTTLDMTVRAMTMVEAYVVPNEVPQEGCCLVRVRQGDPGFVRFAIDRQGYGTCLPED